MRAWPIAIAASCMLALASPGVGQPRPDSPDGPAEQPAPPKLDPKACTDGGPPGDTHETQGSAAPKDNLSDQLARSDGVICPPADIDPDMHQPAPGGGRTPVIPPPGGPGGDPSVRPK